MAKGNQKGSIKKETMTLEQLKRSNGKSKANCLLITLTIVTILISAGTYQIYDKLFRVPEMPELDFGKLWGPNTTLEADINLGVNDVSTYLSSIRPFKVLFTDAMLEQLRYKFDLYRSEVVRKKSITNDWTYGVNSDTLAQVFAHWQFKYVFRDRVKYLNQFNHFKTNIQGLDIHFVHVKPKVVKNKKVLPLILLHGWPSSFREFYDVIPLLTSPQPGHDFVFEVVVPSLPGFAYSQGTNKPGLSPLEIAIVMRNLMQRLGFRQFYVQGGDFGHMIGSQMATIFPDEVLGFHTNFPGNFATVAFLTVALGDLCPKCVGGQLEDKLYPLKEKIETLLEESGYLHLQGTKPDTIGIALNDSPVGLAAYILDRMVIFTNKNNKYLEDGGISKLPLDGILDNIMIYWTTMSITTSMRLYKESFENGQLEQVLTRIPTRVPTWAMHFKNELVNHPDFILRWKYPNLLGSSIFEFGGHLAAFERPKEFAQNVFMAVKNFEKFHQKD